jgi:hypothetical protein
MPQLIFPNAIRRKRLEWRYNGIVFSSPVKKIEPNMFRHLTIALLAVTVSVPLSAAQMRGTIGRPVPMAHGRFARGAANRIGVHHGTRAFPRRIIQGSPFLYSDIDASGLDGFENSAENSVDSSAEAARLRFIVQQSDDSARKTRIRPLLIEWRGDRYVRFGGAEEPAERGTSADPDYAGPTATEKTAQSPMSVTQAPTASPAAELPPTALVYRDGHREEITNYTIADGVIYVRGDYWQNGYWTKHILLSALDPPATIQANRERGVKFMLPSAPNVVIASF